MKKMTNEEKARKILEENYYLTLATCLGGDPWIAPLWYAVDERLVFYFISEYTSIHASHIKQNLNVAFSIYNSQEKPEDVNGLQIKGKAYELGLGEIPHALTAIFKKSGAELFKLRFKDWSNPRTYADLTKFRIYKLVPEHFYILDTTVTENDKRIEVFIS